MIVVASFKKPSRFVVVRVRLRLYLRIKVCDCERVRVRVYVRVSANGQAVRRAVRNGVGVE